MLIDRDLVKFDASAHSFNCQEIPATRFAENFGNRMVANLVMLGFFSAVTGVISAESFKKAIPGSVPERYLELNMKAFERGFDYLKGSENENDVAAEELVAVV